MFRANKLKNKYGEKNKMCDYSENVSSQNRQMKKKSILSFEIPDYGLKLFVLLRKDVLLQGYFLHNLEPFNLQVTFFSYISVS